MECACVYVELNSEISPRWHFDLGFIPAKREVECCECGQIIAPGELYEKYDVLWIWAESLEIKEQYRSYRTCRDCHSIRLAFFCEGWVWTNVHENLWEHIVNIDGELSESCICALTPGAKETVCDLIEDLWVMDAGVEREG